MFPLFGAAIRAKYCAPMHNIFNRPYAHVLCFKRYIPFGRPSDDVSHVDYVLDVKGQNFLIASDVFVGENEPKVLQPIELRESEHESL